MLSLLLGRFLAGPLAIIAALGAICAICGCMKCMKCRIRDCPCFKKLLRFTGHDEFDDFELMILVHEAIFECKESKMSTVVRVTAGSQSVSTDPNSNGIFQQPLHILVEQGTDEIMMELLDTRSRVLATLPLHPMQHVLSPQSLQPEMVYPMTEKPGRGVRHPKIKITMVVSQEEDAERGLLEGHSAMNSDVDILVRQQLRKAKEAGKSPDGDISEMEVLKHACAGPLELFEGLGKTKNVYVAVLGPPTTRRWVLGVWNEQKCYEEKKLPVEEVDLLKVQSVQADPSRHHVFVVNFYDSSRVHQALTFRRVDRARDVWVEILHILVQKARDTRKSTKTEKKSRTTTAGHVASSSSFGPLGRLGRSFHSVG